jgi:hypothetical protein
MINEDLKSCIFCLLDNPEIITYKSICDCHPSIHNECLNLWFEKNPNKCPICLINNQPINIIIVNNNYRVKNVCLFVCFFCCLSMLSSPFLLIGLIVTLTSRPNIYHNTTRT